MTLILETAKAVAFAGGLVCIVSPYLNLSLKRDDEFWVASIGLVIVGLIIGAEL
jgi:hypothetical protein